KSKITLKQQKNINEKRKETLLKKYNVSHNSKIAKVVKNRKQTYFKNKKAGKHKTSIGFKDVNTREKASSMFKKKNPGYLNPYQLPSTRKARKKKGYTKEQITKSKETRFKNYYEIYIQELRKYDLELLCNVEDFKG